MSTNSWLRRARCAVHTEREASAQCRGCGRLFCRECVTESEGAVFCSPCLAARTAPLRSSAAPSWVRRWGGQALALAGLVSGLAIFFALFLLLLSAVMSYPAQYWMGGR